MKKILLFWVSVINSLFCGCINMYIYCFYIVYFCIFVFYFIVIVVFVSMWEISFLDCFKVIMYICLKCSYLIRIICGGWFGNLLGNFGEYFYCCYC